MKILRSTIAVLLAAAAASFAETTYFTDFDTFDPYLSLSAFTTNDPPPYSDWVTTDLNQRDGLLDENSSWAEYPGDQWGAMGGLGAPSGSSLELWHPVDVSNRFSFTLTFGVTTSGGAYSNDDTFGVTFRATDNTALFKVLFVPEPTDPNNTLRTTWVSGTTSTNTNIYLSRNAKYIIGVVGDLDAGDFTTVISSTVTMTSGTFSGTMDATGKTLGAAAATWKLQVPGARGNNLMLLNDYNLVPEPSVALGVLVGGALLVLPRRKRSS